MSRTLFTGAAGLSASQYYINNIGSNIANVNTTGYKPVVTTFSDLLYTKMYVKSADVLSGQGAKASYGGIDPTQSSLVPTGNNMDLAISGSGWFAIETGAGVRYTRDGAFSVSVEGTTAYLVNETGNYVLNKDGKRISQPINAQNAGTATGTTKDAQKYGVDTAALTAQVGVFDFANPEALLPLSSNLYAANAQSGQAAPAGADTQIISGYLEQSGAQMVDGMVDLITAQRAYQLSAKVVQTADEDEQTVNNLRT